MVEEVRTVQLDALTLCVCARVEHGQYNQLSVA